MNSQQGKVSGRSLVRYLTLLALFPPLIAVAPANGGAEAVTGSWRLLVLVGLIASLLVLPLMSARPRSGRERKWVAAMVLGGIMATIIVRGVGDVIESSVSMEWAWLSWVMGGVIAVGYYIALCAFEDRVLRPEGTGHVADGEAS